MATFSINLRDGSVEKPQEVIVGIDLGTTNSLVAYLRNGQPVCVSGADGQPTLVPSVVHFAADGSILVGDAAKEKLITDPAHTIYSVKRLMGKSYRDVAGIEGFFGYQILDDDTDALVKIRVRDRFYTPIELSALILRELKTRVETELNTPVTRAVITVPAYFNDNQRQATRDAGKLAGLDVLRIINEPTAAALAYSPPQAPPPPPHEGGGLTHLAAQESKEDISLTPPLRGGQGGAEDISLTTTLPEEAPHPPPREGGGLTHLAAQESKEGISLTPPLRGGQGGAEGAIVAVYDLGGGTFDLSILRIQDGIFELLSTNGDTFLGGDDFDRAIIDHWLQQLGWTPAQLDADKTLGQTIRLLAERAKKQLSSAEVFESELTGQKIRLTKTEFESLIQPFIRRTLDCCRNAMRDAQLTAVQIEKVVMVGGSTQVPAVKKAVADLFGRPVFDQVNPYEVVALGAAIQADVLAGNQQDVLLLDVTPLSLGIETVGGLMDTIIPRNTKIPTKAGRQYTTSVDGQKNLKITVFQGERDLVEHNRKLGEFILRDIPPMPAGLPKIDIQFMLNADGILTVRARELRSNLEQLIEIKPTYGITEEEMALMLLDSIAHAQGDMKVRGVLEARNEANNLLLSGQKFLSQNDTILSAVEKTTTIGLLEALRVVTQTDDKDAIHRAIEELNTYTMPLAHRAMDATVLKAMHGKNLS